MRKRERIYYAPTWREARAVRDVERSTWPEARIVEYGRGFAVQRYRSGPYVLVEEALR